MPGLRPIARAVISVSLAAFVVSGAAMALRVRDYQANQTAEPFHFMKVTDRSLSFLGRPITFTDTTIGGPDGPAALKIDYGDKSLTLPVRKPPLVNFKDLGAYTEWLQPVFFAPVTRGRIDINWQSGDGVRFALVNRRTAADFDDDARGDLKFKEFRFDVIELTREGNITHRVMQFPAREYTSGKLYLPARKADPNTTVEMLQERSWEWQAALFALPAMQISRYRYSTDAVSAMGWTLPISGVAAMGVMLGIGLLAAARIDERRTTATG